MASADKKRIISIPVSQAAAFAGIDPFGNLCKHLVNLVKDINPKLHRSYAMRAKKRASLAGDIVAPHWVGAHEKVRRLDEQCGTQYLSDVNVIVAQSDSASILQGQQTLVKGIQERQDITDGAKDQLVRAVTEITNCRYGVAHERKVATCLEATSLVLVRQQVRLTKQVLTETEHGLVFALNGVCDGMTAEGTVVEIKSRQRGLFRKVKDYEAVQLLLYMHMSGAQEGWLVEKFQEDMDMKKLYYHPSIADTVLDRIVSTLRLATQVIADEDDHILEQWYDQSFTWSSHISDPTLPPTWVADLLQSPLAVPPVPAEPSGESAHD